MTDKHEAVAIHDQLSGLFSERYAHYQNNPYWDAFTYSRMKINNVLDGYLRNIKTPAEALDVGCGTGHLISDLCQQGFLCTGCDPSDEMLKHARSHNPTVQFHSANIEKLPYASNRFDVVVAIEVMRYIQAEDMALSEVRRVLKPGGLCLLTYAPKFSTALYPLLNKLTSRVQIAGLSKVRQYFHSVGSLRRLYERADLIDVQVHARFLGPFIYVNRLSRPLASRMLRAWEPLDDRLSDLPFLKEFSNLFVVAARKHGS